MTQVNDEYKRIKEERGKENDAFKEISETQDADKRWDTPSRNSHARVVVFCFRSFVRLYVWLSVRRGPLFIGFFLSFFVFSFILIYFLLFIVMGFDLSCWPRHESKTKEQTFPITRTHTNNRNAKKHKY